MDIETELVELLGNRSPELQAVENQEYEQFLTAFPEDGWNAMSLGDYALGTEASQRSYSYALEWGTPNLGSIRGGSADKHVIFKRKNGTWRYPSGFASHEDAWLALRQDFHSLLQAAHEDRWEDTAEIALLRGAKMVRIKTLYLYFPEQILPIYSQAHLAHFAESLGLDHTGDAIVVNRRILDYLRTLKGLFGTSNKDLGWLLYHWKSPKALHSPAYWKIAPGPQASKWEECLENGYICVGWDEVGDLTLFDTKDEFKAAFDIAFLEEYKGNKSKMTAKSNELWRLMQLVPGDKIIANNGQRKILAIGTVNEAGYQWRPDRADYQHTVSVDWDTSFARTLDEPVKPWATTTVLKVTKKLLAKITMPLADPEVALGWVVEPAEEDQYLRWERALDRKKQIIFYGPPGTGKTYSARGFARWLLHKRLELGDYASAEDLDVELRQTHMSQAAWWVTANPARWSWTDLEKQGLVSFDRGNIPRNFDDIRIDDIVVCYESSPVQKVVGLAQVVNTHGDGADQESPLQLRPLHRFDNGPAWAQIKDDPILKHSQPVKLQARGTLFTLTADEYREIVRLAGGAYGVLGLTGPELPGHLTDLTFHASYSYEEFIEGYRPVEAAGQGLVLELRDGLMKRIARTARKYHPAPYIVLIDEINRANVPRVFGELLTVIEADKRGTTVVLPASSELLEIPENLFIIGTMNTADRSIRSLDAALRRRFAFIEVLPDPTLLAGETIDGLALDLFLEGLNRKIADKAGRESQIGHSFFLEHGVAITDPEVFADVIRLEIIPLLQEIVYDDYAGLAEYLGDAIVDAGAQSLKSVVDDSTSLIAALAQRYQANPDPVV